MAKHIKGKLQFVGRLLIADERSSKPIGEIPQHGIQQSSVDAANGRELAHRWNNFDDLLKECKGALEHLEEISSNWPLDGSSSGYNALGEKVAGIEVAIARAETRPSF